MIHNSLFENIPFFFQAHNLIYCRLFSVNLTRQTHLKSKSRTLKWNDLLWLRNEEQAALKHDVMCGPLEIT